jgi:hypothetical protein
VTTDHAGKAKAAVVMMPMLDVTRASPFEANHSTRRAGLSMHEQQDTACMPSVTAHDKGHYAALSYVSAILSGLLLLYMKLLMSLAFAKP